MGDGNRMIWQQWRDACDIQEIPVHPVTECNPQRSFGVSWASKGIGFGEFRFVEKDGQLCCYNETMGKEFIKSMLCKMVDDCVLME